MSIEVEIIIDGKRGKEHRIPLDELQKKVAHRLTRNLTNGGAKSIDEKVGMAVSAELAYMLLDKLGSVRWIFTRKGLRKRIQKAIDAEVREYLFNRIALTATDTSGKGVHDNVEAAFSSALQDLVDERRG